jgi:hypothetical protein
MKKVVVLIAAVFCLSAVAVQAQDEQKKDTTSVSPSQNYRKDMVAIKSIDLPAPVQTTLQDAQYKGWEMGQFFTNEAKDIYVVEIKDASNKTTAYRFDANGRPIKE